MGGANKVMDNYRLFMVPGMNHCGGGPGTTTFDMLAALEQWVEKKQAPSQIPASRVTDGKVERTRPLCPYPQVATYKGLAAPTRRRISFVNSKNQGSGIRIQAYTVEVSGPQPTV